MIYFNNNISNDKNHYYKYIKWKEWILIGVVILVTVILLLIPLITIFIFAFSEGVSMVIINLMNEDMLHAIYLTLFVALITIPVNVFFGILMAWLITRFRFCGRQLLFNLFNIPVAISPVIAGLSYLLCYTNSGVIGNWLNLCGIQVAFTCLGIILVTIFITCPFIVHELVPVMINQGNEEDEAAILLGASGWMMFRYVTFPNIRWALLYGVIITNARSIGEFGAVSIISGLIRGETYTLPLHIELLYQDYNMVGAFVAALLLACISIIMLFFKYYLRIHVKMYY